MNNRFACLMAAGLALAAGPRAVMSASPADHSPGDVAILVDGAPQPRYAHDGRWYVEARKGREYAIRLRNPHGVRVAVALSVDGLNTIDARETTAADARKWVLGPYETVTIIGWQTSRTEARRFEFTTEARSYGQALSKTANLGVISAVFFKERTPAVRSDTPNERAARRPAAAPPLSAPAEQEAAAAAGADKKAADEYAATGMGRRTGHAVAQVWLDLEDAPVQSVNIRYEFHPQLVRLGILPPLPRPIRCSVVSARTASSRASAPNRRVSGEPSVALKESGQCPAAALQGTARAAIHRAPTRLTAEATSRGTRKSR